MKLGRLDQATAGTNWLALCAAGLVLAGCDQARPKAGGKLPTRDEMKKKLTGKGKADVLKMLGKPEKTLELTRESESWLYRRICYDPVSGNADESVWVNFNAAGVVEKLDFL